MQTSNRNLHNSLKRIATAIRENRYYSAEAQALKLVDDIRDLEQVKKHRVHERDKLATYSGNDLHMIERGA